VRAFNRLLGLVVGLALVGGGGFCVVEVILAAIGHRFVVIPGRSWLASLRTTSWSTTTVLVVVAAIAAVGLVLFGAETRRWHRWRLELPTSARGARWWVSSRSLEAHVRRRVLAETLASRARLHLVPRRRRWKAKLKAVAPTSVRAEIEASVRKALDGVGAPPRSKVKVKISPPRKLA
jgi:hypothetical protein